MKLIFAFLGITFILERTTSQEAVQATLIDPPDDTRLALIVTKVLDYIRTNIKTVEKKEPRKRGREKGLTQ